MKSRYPTVPLPNTKRARWLADLVDRGAFTAGGLLSVATEDPDSGEWIMPETHRAIDTKRAFDRRRYWRKREEIRKQKAEYYRLNRDAILARRAGA